MERRPVQLVVLLELAVWLLSSAVLPELVVHDILFSDPIQDIELTSL